MIDPSLLAQVNVAFFQDLDMPQYDVGVGGGLALFQSLLLDNGGTGPTTQLLVVPNTQGIDGSVTANATGAAAGELSGNHAALVVETDADAAGALHVAAIDPTASDVTLSGASAAEQFSVTVGADYPPDYGRTFTVSGVGLTPSETIQVQTDPDTDSLSITSSGAAQTAQLQVSQVGEDGSSATVNVAIPGGGIPATVTLGNWANIETSPIYELISGSTTNLNMPVIVANVTGTQVFGGTPTFTPGYSADPPGTAATVSGSLACSTSATSASTVAGGPYAISNCSGLSSTAGPIAYTYGALSVTPASTAISLASSANPAVAGETVAYTATVTSTVGSVNPDGEGSVTFMSGSTKLCSGAVVLSGDWATCMVTYPGAGSYPVTASYSGGSDFVASSATALNEVVEQDATTTTLGVSSTSVVFGQQLTLTATVVAKTPGSGVPTGTVSFFDGTVSLGTVTLNSSGQSILTTQGLLAGTHAALTAIYSGDPNYLASTSSALQVVVAYASCITGTHTGALTVTAGEVICITGTQTGAVTVEAGGALALVGGHVTGAVAISGATAFLACGATITGALSVQGVTGPVIIGDVLYDGAACAGNTQTGAVSLSDNTEQVALGGSTVTGAVSVTGNVGGPTVIEGNHITGALSCSGNAPAPADDSSPNSVTGARSGQCSASGF